MPGQSPFTILCLSSYEKGFEFMRQCKREGWRVILVTSQSLEGADWPRESLDEIFYMPDKDKEWNIDDLVHGVSYLARTEEINRIVALDDFDVEKAARLREHLRIPGMGDTTARYFRDKLAMRMRAAELGINVPDFVHILNYGKIKEFLKLVPPPYVLKPRMQAGSVGIKKVENHHLLWDLIEQFGDRQSYYLLERFVEGDIYHIDSIVNKKKVEFAIVNKYGKPPMEVAHEGRVFTSQTVVRGTEEERTLRELNGKLLEGLGLVAGVSHTEFIQSKYDGKFYFLETSSRVGGANIAEMVEAASGINLWSEWAKIETLAPQAEYEIPESKKDYAGIILSLSKQEWPDLAGFTDPEIYWRLNKRHHAGLVVKSPDCDRVNDLIQAYTERFYSDFFATQPLREKPSE